ncbi:MAG: hypothetical protein Q8K89_11205 [Actinomycetota bacterium]|nr:hypothetical protein [Actinomycetota bacterium]
MSSCPRFLRSLILDWLLASACLLLAVLIVPLVLVRLPGIAVAAYSAVVWSALTAALVIPAVSTARRDSRCWQSGALRRVIAVAACVVSFALLWTATAGSIALLFGEETLALIGTWGYIKGIAVLLLCALEAALVGSRVCGLFAPRI